MKKMRILALAMALVMSASVFAGCSNNSGNTSTGDGGTTDVPTVSWYTIGGTQPGNFDDVVATMSAYTEEQIGVKLKLYLSDWDTYKTKFQTMINGGDDFDIMFASSDYYSTFVNRGAFLDITEKVKEVTPDLEEFIPDNLWEGVQIGGKVYAVPTYKDSSMTQFWWYDDSLVQKYDLDIESATTMDALTDIFKTVKEGEEAETGETFYPVYLTQGNPWNGFWNNYDDLCSGLGGLVGVQIADDTRKVVVPLEQEDIMHNLGLLHQWYEAGYINPDANVSGEEYKNCFFGNGQAWPSASIAQAKNQGVEKYDYVQVGDSLYTSGTIQGSLNCISKNSKNPDAALKMLQLANLDRTFRDMLAYGKEGEDFEYVDKENGVVKLNENSAWTSGCAKYAQATFFNMSRQETEPETQYDEIKEQNENAVNSVCMGFVFDPTNVQSEIATCNTIWSQSAKADLLTGAVDPEEKVPALLEELRAAGLDTIIEEAQRQVDEFFAE